MEHEVVIRLRIILDIVPAIADEARELGRLEEAGVIPAPKTKTEVIRVCEPETAPRPLRHIRKPDAFEQRMAEDAAPVPSAKAVQDAFAAKWQELGGTSVQTVRLKTLLAEYGETDHTKVSPENRNAFLRALEAMA